MHPFVLAPLAPHQTAARPIRLLFLVVLLSCVASVRPADAQRSRYVAPTGADDLTHCDDPSEPCRTITFALSTAGAGDTLVIADGVYYETSLDLNVDLVVVGAGKEATIVDGDGTPGSRANFILAVKAGLKNLADAGSVGVGKTGIFNVDRAAVQQVFASSHSAWYGSSHPDGYVFRVGEGAHVQIRGITVRDGGGLNGTESSGGIVNLGELHLDASRLEYNISYHADMGRPDGYGRGGAVQNVGTLHISDSEIVGNLAVGAAIKGGRGGGVYNNGRLTVEGTLVDGNETWDIQDVCAGGGIWNSGVAEVFDSRIINNRVDCFEGAEGGGIYSEGSLRLERTIIAANSAQTRGENGMAAGGGVAATGPVVVVNGILAGNSSFYGGGLYAAEVAEIASTTIVDNDALDQGPEAGQGGGIFASGSVALWNAIIAGNRSGGVAMGQTADCMIAEEAQAGFLLTGQSTGCPAADVTVDPANALALVFSPSEESNPHAFLPREDGPAIDAGDCRGIDGAHLETDALRNARPVDDSTVPNVSDGCDLGAIEFHRSADQHLSGALPSEDAEVPGELRLDQNYPNPFSGVTQIAFTVPQTATTRLTVYDLMGREVVRLVDETLTQGEYTMHLDGAGLASGTYLYRLSVGPSSVVKTLTLMR